MTMNLHRLVYYSRNKVAGDAAVLDNAVASILATSRVNNARVGVTGALIFNSGCFGQVLEGARVAVEEIFERIQQDDRHGDVSLLYFDRAPHPAFPTWSMGYVGSSKGNMDHFGSLGRDSGFDPSSLTGDALFETLQRLAIEEERGFAGV